MAPELQIIKSDGTQRQVRLEGQSYMLGRSQTAELAFPDDPGLSRQHLLLEMEAEGWFVTDLNSRNGTVLNGVRLVNRQRLKSGDELRAGQLLMRFNLPLSGVHAPSDRTVIFRPGEIGTNQGAVRVNLEQVLEQAKPRAGAPNSTQWLTPLTALLRAGRELALRRPLPEMFAAILDLSLEATAAERGVLMTFDENGELVVQASRGEGFRISSTVRDTVIREKTSLMVLDTAQDATLRAQESIIFQAVRTLMAVPLQTDDAVIGLLYLDSRRMTRKWTADDLSLLTVMANVAAIRLERERLALADEARKMLAKELDQAAEIQRRFLPSDAPALSCWDIAGHNTPCRTVGGDYYDFLACPEERLGLILGDVAGKGMPAALMMMNLQARVQVLAETVKDPAAFMTSLNRIITSTCPQNRFITLFFGLLDTDSGRLLYVNGGHNPPIIVRADGRTEYLTGGGPILGILPHVQYQVCANTLEPGDLCCIFSDGVTEANNPEGEEFGEERLAAFLASHRHLSANGMTSAIQKLLNEFTQGAALADDTTLIVAKHTVPQSH